MTTNSVPEINSTPQNQNTEWIDKIVSETFDELAREISFKTKLHKSEAHNRDALLSKRPALKIYDDINSYHSFCRLCEQHFYSRSVADDINSFFQKHLNTSYHRELREVCLPPDDVPMFTWEEKFRSGRCNICEMSNLNAYVLQTKLEPGKLMKLHVCVWDKEHRETNLKVLRKLNLLKTYCGLKIFQERLIKTIEGREVCLLCRLKLPWTGEKAKCHLRSDGHYRNFCVLLRNCFNFAPKDVLNGFNLELVTRSIITRDPPPIYEFLDFDEEKLCIEQSNNNENPYSEERDNVSFSPKHVDEFLQNEQTDFIHDGECLLCDVAADPGHMNSDLHKKKSTNVDLSKEKYLIYAKNQSKRLHIMQCMRNLELGEEAPVVRVPTRPKVEEPKSKVPSQEDYFKNLIREKLDLVNFEFTITKNKEVFCQVCDEYVATSQEESHLKNFQHKLNEARWNELKIESANEKFSEPFVVVRNLILCLLCGAILSRKSFYSHLKGEMHKRNFQWYSGLNVSIPISSAITFQKGFSCVCTVCNSLLGRKVFGEHLKTTLKKIRHHWPCPNLKDNRKELRDKLEVIFETNKTLVENNQNLMREVSGLCRTCGGALRESEMRSHGESCGVNLKKVGDTVERIVDVFEKKILKSTLDKSASVIGQLDNSELLVDKLESKNHEADEQPLTKPCGCEHLETCSCAVKPSKETVKENLKKIVNKELKTQKTENKPIHREKEEEEKKEDEHEVLIMSGFPRSKRTYEAVYSKCSVFGKIRYVFFDGKRTIVAFTERGVAERVAKEASLSFNDHQVSLTVATRKAHSKTAEKLPPLNKDLVLLLHDPKKLMDFMLNLIMQATTASESLAEKKREEMVCFSIISAISECFPHGRCYPFGSRLSGLTLNNSDLDVFLDCGGMYEGFKNTTPATERALVNKVAGLLRKKQEITNIVVVNRARVPIISFIHKPTHINCDLSFKNGLSIQNTLLIKFMLSLDRRVKPLILFLKHWAKLNGLHGPPNFSSYAISMMVIYFLEQLERPVLPTIETLQNNYVEQRTTIGGWDCSINTDVSFLKKFDNRDPLPKLLLELFEFYATFQYDKDVISPLTGTPLPRKAFSDSGFAQLPLCYKRHILNIPPPIESLVNKIPICVVDPFDLSHVLTKNFTPRGLQIFTNLCQASAECLKKGMAALKSQN